MYNPLIDLVIKRFLIGDAETANCITEWFDSIDEAVEFMMNEEEDPDLMAIKNNHFYYSR